jgi:uncharacterized protein (TIGR02266 family)
MDPKDRRRFPRFEVSVDVDISSGSNFYAGRARDISLGGLFIQADVGLRPGTEIQVQLTVLHTRLAIPAEVVWVLVDAQGMTSGVGVRFLSVTPMARKKIEAFMRMRPPMDFEIEAADDLDSSEPDAADGAPVASSAKSADVGPEVRPEPTPRAPEARSSFAQLVERATLPGLASAGGRAAAAAVIAPSVSATPPRAAEPSVREGETKPSPNTGRVGVPRPRAPVSPKAAAEPSTPCTVEEAPEPGTLAGRKGPPPLPK